MLCECPCGRFSKSSPRQLEHMRPIAQVVPIPRKRSVHKERIGRADGAVPRVNMPKDMEHRFDPAHCVEKLRASCVPSVHAGTEVEPLKGYFAVRATVAEDRGIDFSVRRRF
jgi:hypothetical protein